MSYRYHLTPKFSGDFNFYRYVGNSPVSWTDYNGLQPKDKHYGHPKRFWDWYHKNHKGPGDPDLDKTGADDWRKVWDDEGQPSGDKKRRKRGDKRSNCNKSDSSEPYTWIPKIPWKKVPGIVIRGGAVVLGAILLP